MKNFLKIFTLSILIILIGMVVYIFSKNEPLNLLYELEDLKVEIEEKPSLSRENTIKYIYEDKIDSLIDVGKLQRAESIVDSLLESDFKHAEEWYFRKGKIFYLKNDYLSAIDFFSKTIEHSQRNYLFAYLWRSYSYAQIGNCSFANEDLDTIIKINSDFSFHKEDVKNICD